jgi:hypothetical protein
MRAALVALIAIAFAAPAFACSCITTSVREERDRAALTFVGRVRDVRTTGHARTITFDVLQAWNHRAPRTVTVETSTGGGSCGYHVEEGESYVIFAHRGDHTATLQISMCSNNMPLLCAERHLRELGRPARRYQRLPLLLDVGTDENPLSSTIHCARRPEWPSNANLGLPRSAHFRRFTVTILRDGSVRDLELDLECAECTPELQARVRAKIEALTFKPATLNGRVVAMRVEGPW